MLSADELRRVLRRAYLPEHLPGYVTAVSAAEPFLSPVASAEGYDNQGFAGLFGEFGDILLNGQNRVRVVFLCIRFV